MARIDNLTNNYSDIADAIRAKTGKTATIKPKDFDTEILSIESGGGSPVIDPSKPLVRFIDFDGTILKEESVTIGGDATAPDTPTHEFLTFVEWNNPLTDIQRDRDIGATYKTTSGETYLFITMSVVTGLTYNLPIQTIGTGGLNVDWGDGSAVENVTTNNKTHTYSSAGDYIIKTKMVDNTENYIMGKVNTTTSYNLTKLYIGDEVQSIGNYAFSGCFSLTNVVIPNSFTSINDYGFATCRSLTSIVIPNSFTSMIVSFYSCFSLTTVVIPNNFTSIYKGSFQSCPSLTNIVMPDSVTLIGNNAFDACRSLTKVVIPNGVQIIYGEVFSGCYSIIEHDFSTHTTVPTLSNINAFNNINKICKIKVPLALLDDWKTKANWTTYANYMVGV